MNSGMVIDMLVSFQQIIQISNYYPLRRLNIATILTFGWFLKTVFSTSKENLSRANKLQIYKWLWHHFHNFLLGLGSHHKEAICTA